MALAILSGLKPSELAHVIRREDVMALRAVPGVGNKTAQRILLDLRDKLAVFSESESEPVPLPDDVEESCISALINLGYPRGQAEKAVRSALEGLPEGPALEDLIREALSAVSR